MHRRLVHLFPLLALVLAGLARADTTLLYDTDSPPLKFAASRLEQSIQPPTPVKHLSIKQPPPARPDVAVVTDDAALKSLGPPAGVKLDPSLGAEGFQLVKAAGDKDPVITVLANSPAGAMYGLLDLAEQLRLRGGMLANIEPRTVKPRFPFRAIKFNLPWSPYRAGPATELHTATCRDLKFWQAFLDMMADNRFNVLSLWNLHPFPYMIRPKNFPEACPFNEDELKQWQDFWHGLFKMANERGVQIYLLNWNICISPAMAERHRIKERNDLSDLTRRYTRECVAQLIEEYPEIAGFGVGLGDWMNNMTPRQREDWTAENIVAPLKAAKRPVQFIHRAPFQGGDEAAADMRHMIDASVPGGSIQTPVWVEIKFNWSHGHSTPKIVVTHSLSIDGFIKPPPRDYKILWTVRNEDFFILRWGDSDFVRAHIAANGHRYVGGYFVGSEGYIPAADYSHNAPSPHKTWTYAFEKQWMFYATWGRLLYDPTTPDDVFAAALEHRYGPGTGGDLLRAYKIASRTPLRIASFYGATWDYTLYSEGFAAYARANGPDDRASPFISVDELIDHKTLDPAMLNIHDFVALRGQPPPKDAITPLRLADDCDADGHEALKLIAPLRSKAAGASGAAGAFPCELDDLETWAYMSLYLAEKIRGGVALATYRMTGLPAEKEKAVASLTKALDHWKKLAEITAAHYHPTPYVSGATFSWSAFTPQAERDVQLARDAAQDQPAP